MSRVANINELLRKEYCPPLDEPTFYAIALDFELPENEDALKAILDDLRAAAAAQGTVDFDPSGTGGSSTQAAPHSTQSRTTPEHDSTSNEFTSITTGLTDLNLKDLDSIGHSLEDLPVEEQQEWLDNLFPTVGEEHIRDILKESKSLDQAVDELLNLAFLVHDEEADVKHSFVRPKGIDGFAEGLRPHQRKGRGNRKNRTNESSRASSTGSFTPDMPASANVWNTAAEDIEFICSRTILQPHTARSVYHANGARLAPTIKALADKEALSWTRLGNVNSILQMQVAEVKAEFEYVSDTQIYGLLILTRNIPSAVCELLEAMTVFSDPEATGRLQAQYAPPDLLPKDLQHETASSDSRTTVTGHTRQLASMNGAAASQAFSQASAAYRKSKSDRLMGGAAAYYASVGHERVKAAKQMQAALANDHVSGQSSSTVLDLHGVSVAQATRIASDRTQGWWDGLGDVKYASGGGGATRSGFRIVTGIGTHSKNHAPRIGPAVTKMLVREGWKVEVGHGELVVTGKSRR